MNATLKFEITLTSDFHIGSGYGRGATVDSALFRDSDGAPGLRGTTLTGLLRDSLRRLLQTAPLRVHRHCLASGLDAPRYCLPGTRGAEICPVCALFGSPAQPKRWHIRSARIEQENYPAQVNQRARISPRTRRAEARKLFSQEDGASPVCFSFEITCDEIDAATRAQAALWVAAARNVRQLGRARRRGRGECVIRLVKATDIPDVTFDASVSAQATMLQQFEHIWLGQASNTNADPIVRPIYVTPDVEANSPMRVRMIARLDEPVLIAQNAEAGNQFTTLPVIAGTTLRGAFAKQAHRRWGELAGALRDDFTAVFQRGGVLFSNLTPTLNLQAREIIPTIPPPFNLQTCSVFPARLSEYSPHPTCTVNDLENVPDCPRDHERLEPFDRFLPVLDLDQLTGERQQSLARNQCVEIHNAIDPQTQRVGARALFGYVALAAGQYFVGDIYFATARAWAQFKRLTDIADPTQPFPLRLGKAARRGYGKVTAYFDAQLITPTLINQPLSQRLTPGAPVLLTFLSDAIFMDRWGRQRAGWENVANQEQLAKLVSDALGITLTVFAFVGKAGWVDGFQDTHNLPRWRGFAIRAGSTLQMELPAQLTDKQSEHLAQCEWIGIGDRRNEGFGRIAFNHPIYQGCKGIKSPIILPAEMKLPTAPSPLHSASRDAWQSELYHYVPVIADPTKRAPLGVLASWLHTHSAAPLQELIDALSALDKTEASRFGVPDGALVTAIGGADEYGNRQKESFFHQSGTNKGAADRARIQEWLTRLRDDYPPEFYPLGVQMLAERLATFAREAAPINNGGGE